MFLKITGNMLCLYFSFFTQLSHLAESTKKKKRIEKKEKVCLLATDIKQIMNNQSKAITSNPEAENNSVQQLR